ncbi:MAG: ABC transporter ATP-binding protein [Oscillospiraceae bacterium]|nr:ABC transporter ATP-binding protein [Oscillospiraceae bacterium]
MRLLGKYMGKYRFQSVMAPLLKMAEALFDLFVPIVMARLINTGIGNGDRAYILKQTGILVMLGVIGLIFSITAQYFAARASVMTCSDMRRDVFAHVHELSFRDLDRIGNSTLITRMTSDLNQVQNGLNLGLRLLLRSPFIVFGSVIMAFTVDAKAAWVFVVAVPLLGALFYGIMLKTLPMYRDAQKGLDAVTEHTREQLTGVRVIRAFVKEEDEEREFSARSAELKRRQLSVGGISSLMNPLSYVIINLGIAAVLYIGAVRTDAGLIMSGEVIALVNYMGQMLIEIEKLANLIIQMTRAGASLGRVEELLAIEPSQKFGNAEVDDSGNTAVEFDHVSVRYNEGADESLQDVSFTALKGETIGIIGGTGSGKTTLVSLIPRYYDATGGQVRVFGRDVRDYRKDSLRDRVLTVQQTAKLFSGTVRSNLLMGNPGASDEELWSALETAQAADFIRAKEGLDTVVEQDGRNLSGGQKQRLSIARAVAGHPDVLIMDDSASALDFATDAALRKAVKGLGDMTVFIVSQRASNVMEADRILVLDDGILVGSGTHAELLKDCEVYRDIYGTQFGGEEAGA